MAKDKVSKKLSVAGATLTRKFVMNVEVDFSGCSEDEIKAWAMSNLVVSIQKTLKGLPEEELARLETEGYKVHAKDAGRKVETYEEKVSRLVAVGIPKDIAEKLVDNPELGEQLVIGS